MSKKNRDYWNERFRIMEAAQHELSEQKAEEIRKMFDHSIANIEKKIAHWYYRVAENNEVSMAKAMQMVSKKDLEEFRWTVDEYIKHGQENAKNQKWIKELENASARVHIGWLEMLKYEIRAEAEKLFDDYTNKIDTHISATYMKDYYHTAYEIQKGFEVGSSLQRLDRRMVEKVIYKPWAVDGKNFSERIWDDRTKLVNTLHKSLSVMCITGAAPDQAISEIAKAMGVSRNRAGTLVMTESAAFANKARQECMKELDVEEFEVVETLDTITCNYCRDMDGKHFPMDQHEIGVTSPPFHPNCRGCTCPYFDDEFMEGGERAARGEDGKTYYVPADMTYKEWEKSFLEGDKSGLKEIANNGKIEVSKIKMAMTKNDYEEYMKILNDCSYSGIKTLYEKYGDVPENVAFESNNIGYYKPSTKELVFKFPTDEQIKNGRNKYHTLAHEYGHCFDHNANFGDLHYTEIEYLNSKCKIGDGAIDSFEKLPSSSDEFLSALREDKEGLRKLYTSNKEDILSTAASAGVQDTVRGLFGQKKVQTFWGHGESYYNRKYNNRIKAFGLQHDLKRAYTDLGLDASNQRKVQNQCRIYETASETWANIISAITCGGKELDYVKRYLPKSHNALVEILEGVK